MSAVIVNRLRKGMYLDSVALMRFSRSIAALDGVEEAALMMATPANLEIMGDAGLLDDRAEDAHGGDLMIAIRARDQACAGNALATAEDLLDQPRAAGSNGVGWRPRTIRTALEQRPGANLALISVPGDFAASEARKAIRRGLPVMIFSDNVSVDEEIDLKREARELGRLVMGPDCGTAIINGAPIAFANRVPRGDVGIIGASGTGIQEVSSLIERHGGGISHALGVGGRDLSEAVGGISTLMALDALANDESTRHIVLISKPPSRVVTRAVLDRIAAIDKPVTVCFIGAQELEAPRNAGQVFTLRDAAMRAVGKEIGVVAPCPAPSHSTGGYTKIRGLFSGGTLCAEAQAILLDAGADVASNAPIPGAMPARDDADAVTLLDLGDDAYTRGRPHPMIDPEVRDAPVAAALGDPDVAVILLDVVIGLGAHGDPAGHLVRSIRQASRDKRPVIIASVTGTDADPQGRSAQVGKLEAEGVIVAPTNADAAAWAREILGLGRPA